MLYISPLPVPLVPLLFHFPYPILPLPYNPHTSSLAYIHSPEAMWCQWSAPCRLGDDPIRPAQHEYRFPTIIQLDEVAPPPPSSQKALLSPVPSSGQSYDYYTSSEECEEVENEEEEEEATESYCSSDPSCPEFGMEDPERASVMASAPVEQKAKMSRVLAWRNSFDSVSAEDHAGRSRLFLPLHPWPCPIFLSCHSP